MADSPERPGGDSLAPFRIDVDPGQYESVEDAADAVLDQLAQYYKVGKSKLMAHCIFTYADLNNMRGVQGEDKAAAIFIAYGGSIESGFIDSDPIRRTFWISGVELDIVEYDDKIDVVARRFREGD